MTDLDLVSMALIGFMTANFLYLHHRLSGMAEVLETFHCQSCNCTPILAFEEGFKYNVK